MTLVEGVAPKWAIRIWEIYYGDYYMGKIVKREYGGTSPLSPGDNPKIIFTLTLNIFTGEGEMLPWAKVKYYSSLKEAKLRAKKLIRKFNKQLSK